MVLVGATKVTQFSYLEYQLLMLSLAGTICTAIGTVEIALRRFQVLPLLFPGMFSVRERRFYFFNFDISDGTLGKRIRAEAKMLIRITLCVVLSYLWQHCVLETTQQVGTDFPTEQCAQDQDCFASEFHFFTLFNRHYEAIDCSSQEPEPFSSRVVVSCIRFISPSATNWLMHLAIANSVTQLNFKAFEVLVWIAGNSNYTRYFIGFLILVSLLSFVGLFFGGVMSEFVSSWLSFVMSLAIPAFLHTTWKCAKALDLLWRLDAISVQQNIEMHLNDAFTEIEQGLALESRGVEKDHVAMSSYHSPREQQVPGSGSRTSAISTFRKVVKGFHYLKPKRSANASATKKREVSGEKNVPPLRLPVEPRGEKAIAPVSGEGTTTSDKSTPSLSGAEGFLPVGITRTSSSSNDRNQSSKADAAHKDEAEDYPSGTRPEGKLLTYL